MINRTKILMGIVPLLIGISIYLIDRPPWQVPLLPSEISLFYATPKLFFILGDNIPTFLHIFAFYLICSGIIGGWHKANYLWSVVCD